RDHIVAIELLDHRLHQRHGGAGAHARLHVVELTVEIYRRAVRNRRYLTDALEGLAVADAAWDGLAAAGRSQRLAPANSAPPHLRDKSSVRIASLRARLILRKFDDAVADRLDPAVLLGKAHRAGAALP